MKMELEADIEKLVRETTEAALAAALTKNGNTIVQEIVRHALNQKAENYGKETVLQKALRKAIVDNAIMQVNTWVKTNQGAIASLVAEEIQKTLTPKSVAAAMVESFTNQVFGIKHANMFCESEKSNSDEG